MKRLASEARKQLPELATNEQRPPSPTSPSEFLRRRYETPGINYGAPRGVPKWFGSNGEANAATCRDLPRALPVWTESVIGRTWTNVLPRNGRTGLPGSSFDAGPYHQDPRHQDLLAVLPWHGGRCCKAAELLDSAPCALHKTLSLVLRPEERTGFVERVMNWRGGWTDDFHLAIDKSGKEWDHVKPEKSSVPWSLDLHGLSHGLRSLTLDKGVQPGLEVFGTCLEDWPFLEMWYMEYDQCIVDTLEPPSEAKLKRIAQYAPDTLGSAHDRFLEGRGGGSAEDARAQAHETVVWLQHGSPIHVDDWAVPVHISAILPNRVARLRERRSRLDAQPPGPERMARCRGEQALQGAQCHDGEEVLHGAQCNGGEGMCHGAQRVTRRKCRGCD
ncbi:hypothetical protein PG999_010244 [Apiospora kogelbergensis]|uniref:Uncharacterized protein n=1 Tax=Apiospora kogelbergensis TaxID=1337665 RepID=A0AAW0Q9H7_9PEZI